MKALFICENLIKAITSKEIIKGRVHSVFSKACNIETEHNLITLLSPEKQMSPMSVIVDLGTKVNFRKLNLTQNLEFNFSVNGISCREKNICISLDYSKIWSSGPKSVRLDGLDKGILENIKIMENGLNTYGKLHGAGPLISMLNEELPELELSALKVDSPDKHFEFTRDRFLDFIQDLTKGNVDKIAERAERIIGFGPGLTPSMDDFICGLMISFIFLGAYYRLDLSSIFNFNQKLISQSLDKTTRVSSEMLKHAAVGETNQAVKELMRAILSYPNEEKIVKALVNTIELGETSGSDTVLGIYAGCKIMTNSKYRGEWL